MSGSAYSTQTHQLSRYSVNDYDAMRARTVAVAGNEVQHEVHWAGCKWYREMIQLKPVHKPKLTTSNARRCRGKPDGTHGSPRCNKQPKRARQQYCGRHLLGTARTSVVVQLKATFAGAASPDQPCGWERTACEFHVVSSGATCCVTRPRARRQVRFCEPKPVTHILTSKHCGARTRASAGDAGDSARWSGWN
jgi:hypothetical protein